MARCMISVREDTVSMLSALRVNSETLDDVIYKLVAKAANPPGPPAKVSAPEPILMPKTPGRYVLFLFGETTGCWTLQEVLTTAIGALAKRDPKFLERLAEKRTRCRRVVARIPEDLYPDSPHLATKHSRDIGGGWWLATNCSRTDVRRHLRLACATAGAEYGVDIKVRFG